MNASDWLKQSVGLFTRKTHLLSQPAQGLAVPTTTSVPLRPPSARTTSQRLQASKAKTGEALKPKALAALLAQLKQVVDSSLSEIEAARLAQTVAHWYGTASLAVRADCWALMSEQFGLDAAQVQRAFSVASASAFSGDAEIALRRSLNCSRTQLIQRFAAFPDGVKFLIDLRADVLKYLRTQPDSRASLQVLDTELENLFATWFDVAFLELRKISWDSPASLIEKLIRYEAVHHIQSWADVKNRLDSDRRCYGFFHPRLPDEPLIFVEVAFTQEMASTMTPILDDAGACTDLTAAKTANFYSISNTQTGLKGVGFGDSLIKQVVQALQQELPQLKTFTTLSPIPTFKSWLTENCALMLAKTSDKQLKKLVNPLAPQSQSLAALAQDLLHTLDAAPLAADAELALWVQQCAAYYLTQVLLNQAPRDPVAKFHLSNGATVARLNWAADLSSNGAKQSYGLMVNYLYDLKRLDKNRKQLALGKIASSSAVQAIRF